MPRSSSFSAGSPRPRILGPVQSCCGQFAGIAFAVRNITVALPLKRKMTFAIELIVNVFCISMLPRVVTRNSRELIKIVGRVIR